MLDAFVMLSFPESRVRSTPQVSTNSPSGAESMSCGLGDDNGVEVEVGGGADPDPPLEDRWVVLWPSTSLSNLVLKLSTGL